MEKCFWTIIITLKDGTKYEFNECSMDDVEEAMADWRQAPDGIVKIQDIDNSYGSGVYVAKDMIKSIEWR